MDEDQRSLHLSVLEALLKVMKTRKLFPKDVNNLLLLTRKLANKSPEFEDLKNFNLLPYGDAIVEVGGYFYVVDQIGKYENCRYIKSEAKKRDTLKNWPLIKNP